MSVRFIWCEDNLVLAADYLKVLVKDTLVDDLEDYGIDAARLGLPSWPTLEKTKFPVISWKPRDVTHQDCRKVNATIPGWDRCTTEAAVIVEYDFAYGAQGPRCEKVAEAVSRLISRSHPTVILVDVDFDTAPEGGTYGLELLVLLGKVHFRKATAAEGLRALLTSDDILTVAATRLTTELTKGDLQIQPLLGPDVNHAVVLAPSGKLLLNDSRMLDPDQFLRVRTNNPNKLWLPFYNKNVKAGLDLVARQFFLDWLSRH